MKSLQQQVQSINMTPAASAAAAVHPAVLLQTRATVPRPTPAVARGQVRPGTVVPMVPYGAMIPYAHYHAVMMPPPAVSSALPAMIPASATSAAPEGQCSISTEQQWKHKKDKGKR